MRTARLAIALLLLVPAACSSDGSGGTGPGGTPVIAMAEFLFEPGELTVVAAADPIDVVVRNRGDVTHDWTLLARSVTSEAEMTDDIIIQRVVVMAGESETVSLAGLEPGRYQFVCAIPGHFTLGMTGILEITPSR